MPLHYDVGFKNSMHDKNHFRKYAILYDEDIVIIKEVDRNTRVFVYFCNEPTFQQNVLTPT